MADWGSKESLASMSVQISSRRVAAARADSMRLVRPEDSGPQTSVRHPRGRPPVRASIWAMPLEAVSGAGRIARREAGVTPLRVAENCFKRFAEVERAAKGK